jgi:hypothetical protein
MAKGKSEFLCIQSVEEMAVERGWGHLSSERVQNLIPDFGGGSHLDISAFASPSFFNSTVID